MTIRGIRRAVAEVAQRNPITRAAWRGLSRWNQRRSYARLAAATPTDPRVVVFQSFGGRSYADSPKALYRAMLSDPAFDSFEFVWVLKDPDGYRDGPDFARATLVRAGSPECFAAFARAGCWIANSRVADRLVRKTDQRYVQTWHGTPLKRLGYDVATSGGTAKLSKRELQDLAATDVRRYTHLLSPSRFTSDCLRSAFALDRLLGRDVVVEEGYPRNDFLHAYTSEDAAAIRTRLGIPAGKRTVLYAPTWREDEHDGTGYTLQLAADFGALRAALGDEYVVLFRAHYFVASAFDFAAHAGFVIDVSGVDDVAELFVVSDLLVTDYSSVLFDYANLKRPMVFFMYDLDHYAGDLRGFYLPLEELPGPIVKTTRELASAITAAFEPGAGLDPRYDAFCARFTYLDDGHASERVLARVFGSSSDNGAER